GRPQMRRREFVALVGSASLWPHSAAPQQSGVPVIGILGATSPRGYSPFLDAFRQGLRAGGYIEGENVIIEYRWAEGKYDSLPALAADLRHRGVTVIAAIGGTAPTLAAAKETSTIPIVFVMSSDPVDLGLASSLSSPRKNVTGVAIHI